MEIIVEKLTFLQFRTLAIVLIIALISMFGTDIHLASLPAIANSLHTNKVHMQQSISVFLFGMGVSMLIYGPLSDKIGRKPIIILGLIIAILGNFASIYATDIHYFLFCRVIQGIGLGIGSGIGRTIFADVLNREQLAIIGSYFSMVISVSPLFAPIIGGYLQTLFGWQSNFILLTILSLMALILYIKYCPETNIHKNKNLSLPTMLYNYLSLLKNHILIYSIILTGIGLSAIMVYTTTSAFILQNEFKLTPILYGWVTMIAGCGIFAGKLVGPSLIKRVTSLQTIKIGLILILMSGIYLTIISLCGYLTITNFMLAVFISYLGNGFMMPSVTAQALSGFKQKRGTASALFGACQMIIASSSSSIIASIHYNGSKIIAIAYLVLGALGLIVYDKLKKALIMGNNADY